MYKKYILLLPLLLFFGCNYFSKTKFKHTNDLINETSPYLLQHAHNPVNWKSWNQKTLDEAKAQNKLLLISIGYSACHWCHVMEKESFENDSIAKIMNDNFVCIKVDREERPDIDQLYLNAVQLMTGNSGWPLNCVCLPDGRPVFGGTYFSKDEWSTALLSISDLYKTKPQEVKNYASKLMDGMQSNSLIKQNSAEIVFKKSDLDKAVTTWEKMFDYENGGFLSETKFPNPASLHFLLRYGVQNKDKKIIDFVTTTLTKMANGGIYDAIGGGFSRYTVDNKWHIPHFEKMLYDNAQLVSLYSDAYLVTKNEGFKTVITETITFVNRDLTASNGALFSSLDADSKNEKGSISEGAFYVWKPETLKKVLKSDYALFAKYYNIQPNFVWEEGKYILNKTTSDVDFANSNKINVAAFQTKIAKWKKLLFEERKKRSQPRLDDKTLTSWNALMLKAYVQAYKALKNNEYKQKAIQIAAFIDSKQRNKDFSLQHSFKNDKSSIEGFSEDYAMVSDAFIALYQITFDEKYLQTAKKLTDYMLANFQDTKTKMFYFTSSKSKKLAARSMEIHDNVIPSSNSVIAQNLYNLSHYFSNAKYAAIAKQQLHNVYEDAKTSPASYYNWLQLLLNYTHKHYEVAISGKDAFSKINQFQNFYLPNVLFAGATKESKLPIMEYRWDAAATYIYVCEEGSCKLPDTEVAKALTKIKTN